MKAPETTAPDRLDVAMGKVLRGLRGELGWSQKETGVLLGVGQRTLSDMENAERAILAADIVRFSARFATVLPYSELEIRERFFASPHLSPVPVGADDLTSASTLTAKGGKPRAKLRLVS